MQDETPTQPSTQPGPPAIDSRKGDPRRIRSDDLFSGAREIVIEHDGRLYQLRITQNGKLILTA